MRLEPDLTTLRAAASRKEKAEREVLSAIFEARRNGASLRDIADAANYSHQRIHQIVRAANAPIAVGTDAA